ncbi:MAG: sigma-70 family RNA polymerase sigma factor [Myxococcales bacterium FL481]|nr:MAG: sigma-70 family RNA polymerase sigma factor [Myxococcales bacterium FL481]
MSTTLAQIVETHSQSILAALTRRFRDFDLAEEALQEALAAASVQWPRDGVPDRPRAWLIATAKFKAIDALRRRARQDRATREHAERLIEDHERDADTSCIEDDQLALIFACCHPTLSNEAKVALTLREVCGLGTDEVARCFLVSSAAMKKRLSRAKAQLRAENARFDVPQPEQLPQRLGSVLQVIYLVFNEGYAATSGDRHIRLDLVQEATFLARTLADLLPHPEALGLLALLLLHDSRRDARTDRAGELVRLEDQNRSSWDQAKILEGQTMLAQAILSGRLGVFTLQALIASVHASATTVETTNWDLIVHYYELLFRLTPSPIIELQGAIAVAMRDGPAAGESIVERLVDGGPLERLHSAHAVRADLALRRGHLETAAKSFKTAISLARPGAERRFLERQLEYVSKKIAPGVPRPRRRST